MVWVSNSQTDPYAISRNLTYSMVVFLPYPSAIFDGIETANLFICEINPYTSSLKNVSLFVTVHGVETTDVL